MAPELEVDLSRLDGTNVLAVRGELELGSALGLAGPLSEVAGDGEGPVLLDLTGLTFMDSTGMSVLLTAWRRLSRQGRPMAVVCPGGAVRRLFEMTKLVETLGVHPTREAAMSVLDGG